MQVKELKLEDMQFGNDNTDLDSNGLPDWPRETLIPVKGKSLRYELLSQYLAGDMLVRYQLDPLTRQVGLSLIPLSKSDKCTARRMSLRGNREIDSLPDHMADRPAWKIFNIIQLKIAGDAYASGGAGSWLGNSESTKSLIFDDQYFNKEVSENVVITTFYCKHKRLKCNHYLSWYDESKYFKSYVTCENISGKDILLEQISSFSIGDLSPFCEHDACGRLIQHSFKSNWSAEARMVSERLDRMHFSGTWIPALATGTRFGHTGSWPTCDYFPFVAVEDEIESVVWAAQLWHPGSWQMGLVRNDDAINMTGGIADRTTGSWMKRLKAGEVFSTPLATLTVCEGDFEDSCRRLLSAQRDAFESICDKPDDMSIVFNEWASSWGEPTHDSVLSLAQRLNGTPVKYLVIDAGWFKPFGCSWNDTHGDWLVSKERFPDGLDHTVKLVEFYGLEVGLWFEFETCGSNSQAYHKSDMLLKRDGVPLTVGCRHFLDFKNPDVWTYLNERVVNLLKFCGIKYVKVDYNTSIGIGVDGAESLGEGMRLHLEKVQDYFKHLKKNLPELVLENCASGGMRLEPSMMSISDLASFTDAHECKEIPVIAASLQRLILPQQSGVWVIVRKQDSYQQLLYTISSGFLGRYYLSGDITDLDPDKWDTVVDSMKFYDKVSDIIKSGVSYFFGTNIANFRDLEGWQAVLRVAADGGSAIAVLHSFGKSFGCIANINLPEDGRWEIVTQMIDSSIDYKLVQNSICIKFTKEFTAGVIHLVKRERC